MSGKQGGGDSDKASSDATIDIEFCFTTDTRPGGDPDCDSPTLHRYHKLLWSKPLPNGAAFDLSDTTPGVYLHHCSELGEFFLSSDAGVHTYTPRPDGKWLQMKPTIERLPESDVEDFKTKTYTIGAMIVFPYGRGWSINRARGFHSSVRDRFDLTIECIRRHYALEVPNPLNDVIALYADFFALFGDFRGYIDFFLLNDLVNYDDRVRFFLPYGSRVVPGDVATYEEYRHKAVEFVDARNRRIKQFVLDHHL